MNKMILNRICVALLAAAIVMCCGCGNGSSEVINEEITANETTVTVISAETGTSAETEAVPTEPSLKNQTADSAQEDTTISQEKTMHLYITVGDTVLTANLEENTSAEALVELLKEEPKTVQMVEYAGMEKYGDIGTSLPKNDSQISVGAGDIILYQGNLIAIYYGTNSWNLTKLASIENVTGNDMLKILGEGDVEVTFSVE